MDLTKLIQLKPEEEVIMVVHQSVIPLLPKIVLACFWIVLPFFLLFPLFHVGAMGVIIFLVLLLSGLWYGFRLFWIWRNTIFIITDRRIVDVDQRGLFSRMVSEAAYQVIQDVSYEVRGLIPTLCRFGTVIVQTAGNSVNLEVYHVHMPATVHDLINDLRHPS